MKEHPKLEKLRSILTESGKCVIAFSGGVDSSFLLKVAVDTIGEKAVAVTAHSPIYFQKELEEATAFTRSLGVRHRIIQNDALSFSEFRDNPPQRCYLCKRKLFEQLHDIAAEEEADCIMDATNMDDFSDFRPGLKAVEELAIKSPLAEAGIYKKEIREMAHAMGLSFWDKPAMACLASRIPYGTPITEEALEKIEKAETFLQELGFRKVRVRCHDALARIETPAESITALTEPSTRTKVVQKFKELGFHYISIDLEGYRTGSLNELLGKQSSS